jgi:hypothetical protein
MLANQFCGQTWSRECSAWLANVEDLIADVANSKTSQPSLRCHISYLVEQVICV